MKDRFRILSLLLISVLLLFVIGCSSGADDDDNSTDTGGAASLSIGVSGSSVKSDDSNSVTVTATVLDSNNAAIEGVTVQFSADRGALSASSAVTDASGAAQVSFKSGVVNQSNGTATITATLGELTAMVPVLVTGTTVTVNQENTTLSSSSATSNLEVYVTDASGDGIYNTEVSIEQSSGTGSVTWTSDSDNTGVDGTLNYTVAGQTSGSVVLTISAANATVTCEYTVETTGNILQITAPTDTPATLAIGESLTVTVSDPDRGQVVISTTLGMLNGSASAVTLDASTGTASATLTTNQAGKATIEAYNTSNIRVKDSITVSMYAPASNAAQITIQASSTVVALSNAELSNSVEISARVTDASGNPVGEAPVIFTMTNTPGGGESLTPAVAYTYDGSEDSEDLIVGQAIATFTSGSISTSGQGLTITATLLTATGPSSTIKDSINIIIGGTSGSVVIGESTTVSSINNDTAYQLPVSVLVSDSNGNPVPGAIVTINLWPRYYWVGNCVYGQCDDDDVPVTRFDNEDDYYGPNDDRYRNQYLDTGEDANGDGELTPPNSSSGSMPQTITADDNGVGTFNWVYLKTYAYFITAEIKVSTEVLGSETTTTVLRTLRASQDDLEDGVLSGESPFTAPPP